MWQEREILILQSYFPGLSLGLCLSFSSFAVVFDGAAVQRGCVVPAVTVYPDRAHRSSGEYPEFLFLMDALKHSLDITAWQWKQLPGDLAGSG